MTAAYLLQVFVSVLLYGLLGITVRQLFDMHFSK